MDINTKPTFCPYCDSRAIIKKGSRKNLYRRIQLYFCKTCRKYFSPLPLKRVKYPPRLILRAISLYDLGYSQEEVSKLMTAKYHLTIPRRTISDWAERFAPICTFQRLRPDAKSLYKPEKIIASLNLDHNQVYRFRIHRAKLDLPTNAVPERTLDRLKQYLASIQDKDFPHDLFRKQEDNQAARSSQTELATLPLVKLEKQNLACDLANLGLQLARTNKERHDAVQSFMLTNDSTTIACEVPVYLTLEEIAYFARKGFHIGLEDQQTPITGHIDVLQVRNGLIHILDYKPDAYKVNPVSQLVIYALALASRSKLPLRDFKCAWFDERNYFEFFPLHAVYARAKRCEPERP
ncbi:MAG: PD-(D/E)XK nuclease family protein [Chloroflexi bacterium]|nr:PD-(D/E)XK nuclease family protein [Chloroflexota bacterium]